MAPTETHTMSGITIRKVTSADASAVARLAELDSASAPEGELLGAEVEGRLLAVAPIGGGPTIADPFSRTGELAHLLELRAEQLRRRVTPMPRRRRLFASRRLPRGLPSAPAAPGGTRLASEPLRPF